MTQIPYAPQGRPPRDPDSFGAFFEEGPKNPIIVLVIGLVFAPYVIVWGWLTASWLNKFLQREQVNKVLLLVGMICCFLFPLWIYVAYMMVKGLEEAQQKAGLPVTVNMPVMMLTAICVPFVYAYLYQLELNNICDRTGAPI